ncbi:MAG: transglutaminase-like domain-containing protein [Bacteroidales bacterium]|jgi:hypothetical protein|nr:transglutaminase-like domain-containing protein [Bacteroidales bacterium]
MKSGILLSSVLLLFFLGFNSCRRGDHFISDEHYREKVRNQFEVQKKLAKNRAEQLFHVFDSDLSLTEKEALEFLFAYMSLSDLADYDGEFYLKNVRASLAARDTFPWGKSIPENVFRHFVLPVRVNNENLDSCRCLFFMELKDRIKSMTMKDAVLEVNHWCHEKVTYRGTDGRTSSPLATVKTAFGRCGEESTFTTAALRAVGIPARQCYTPRWAHTDDNHAWVEVWVDGKWHFIGACEPEADLDMAWFSAPVKRAMLVNTNVFGDYEGPEDILIKDPRYTKINILSNYATTKRIVAKVIDEMKRPVGSAVIEFQLYNYAEFYPLHKAFTDKNGLTSFITGFGDLILWAAKNGKFGYRKVMVKNTDTAVIELNRKPGVTYTEAFDLTPPPEVSVINSVSDSLKTLNSKRIEFEDKTRASYESTFIDSAKTTRLAVTLKINTDTLWYFLKLSRGNWREIIDFITGTPKTLKSLIFPLLQNISEKDLHDVTPDVLLDNINNSKKFKPLTNDNEIFYKWVLSPRVDNEWLKPYKAYFQEKTEFGKIEKFRKNPEALISWIKANIILDHDANYSGAPLTPIGSFELKVADPHSVDILFVGMCRSFGIPARLESGTRVPQYLLNGTWKDVYFEKQPKTSNKRGTLVLSSDPVNGSDPGYYTHYTIEKYSDGFFRSLDYETDPQIKTFPCTLQVTSGYYLLVTGNRIQDGIVMASLSFFNVKEDKQTDAKIILRKNLESLPVLGNLDLKTILTKVTSGTLTRVNLRKGAILAILEPDKEPSKHFISDLKMNKRDFSSWGGPIFLLFTNEKEKTDFKIKNESELPSGIQYAVIDPNAIGKITRTLKTGTSKRLPLVLFVNQNGDINYLSEGYRIGIGDDLKKIIRR